MPNPVVHFEVTGSDGKKLQDWYAGIFGWTVNADNPMNYGIVEPQGAGISGGISEGEAGARSVTFYIAIEDPQAALARVESLGGKTVMPVTEIPGMVTIARFADPEGNVIGLVKSGGPPPA